MKRKTLAGYLTVHCFWWPRCRHTVEDRPEATSEAMEQHYAEKHRADTDRIVGWLR